MDSAQQCPAAADVAAAAHWETQELEPPKMWPVLGGPQPSNTSPTLTLYSFLLGYVGFRSLDPLRYFSKGDSSDEIY